MLTVKREALLWAMNTAKGLIGKSPIAAPLQLRAGEADLTIEGTNLDQCIRIKLPADVKRVMTGAAPFDAISALSSATGDEVKVYEKGARLCFEWGKAGRSSCTWTDKDLVDMPTSKTKPMVLDLTAARLKQLMICALAASTDETRIHLCGVNIGTDVIAGTDGHRCHILQPRIPIKGEWSGPTVPVPFLTLLDKLIAGRIPTAKLLVDSNHVSCELEHEKGLVKVWSKMTDSSFPDIRQVLPTTHNWRVWVNAKQMLDLVTRAKNTGADGIRVSGDPSIGLRLKVAKEVEFEDGIEAEFENGTAMVPVGVAPKYLLDALKVCDEGEEKVCISGTVAEAPIVIGLPEGRDMMSAIVMPMRL